MNPTVFWTIATVMVVLCTAAVVIPVFWVRPAEGATFDKRRLLAAIGLSAGIPLAALAMYATVGSPALVGQTAASPGSAMTAPHDGAMGGPSEPAAGGADAAAAGDMEAAIARLEARLQQEPGDVAGWQLLAQSYEFVGRSADAERARARAGGAPAGAAPGPASTAPAGAAASAPAIAANGSVDALVNTAQTARRNRDFKTAIANFEQLAKRNAMSADLWADYADAVGASRGRLDESSEALLAKALALDPNHPKALWLLGSLQVERADYRSALATWQRMQKVLPPDSSDARLIAANIAEARAALGAQAPPAPAAVTAARGAASPAPAAAAGKTAPTTGVTLRGEVQLDARWRGKVAPDTVLYIFAKAVGQPGPPVAVFRTSAARWPVAFVLDDSLSMMPGRNLSASSNVVIEARLSRSGSANPQAGDLRGSTPAMDPRKAGMLRVLINEEIG